MTKRTTAGSAWAILLTAWAATGLSAQAHVPGVGHGPSSFEAPLRLEGGRMIVEVRTAEGEPLDFAVSVGNGALVLTESTVARLGRAPSLTLGGVPVVTEGVHTYPDESLATGSTRVAGMIGANTLSRYDVLFDAPGGRMLLAEPARSVSWPGYTLSEPVPLRVFHGIVLSLDVVANDGEYPAGLDLGSRSMLVNDALATAEGLETRDELTLRLGASAFPGMPTETTDHPMFERWDPSGRGFLYLGSAIAEGCPISVSWVHRELRTCVR